MKSKIIKLTLITLSILSVLYLYRMYTSSDNKKSNQLTNKGASYNEITPNLSTKEDLYNKMGDPVKQELVDNSVVFEYKSNNPNYNDEFKLDSNKVVFIKKNITIEDNIDVKTITDKYGQYENVLYGPRSQSGFDLYIYPTKGVAYIGNQYTEDITEIWYFPPTDIKTFNTTYAPEYSEKIEQKSH